MKAKPTQEVQQSRLLQNEDEDDARRHYEESLEKLRQADERMKKIKGRKRCKSKGTNRGKDQRRL